jgi:hypothetical protein
VATRYLLRMTDVGQNRAEVQKMLESEMYFDLGTVKLILAGVPFSGSYGYFATLRDRLFSLGACLEIEHNEDALWNYWLRSYEKGKSGAILPGGQ